MPAYNTDYPCDENATDVVGGSVNTGLFFPTQKRTIAGVIRVTFL
jgi:hypothetical protein